MKIGTSRVEAFSDGVIAIIITIMVLELKLPDVSTEATTRDILHHLVKLGPYFGAYVFSFMMVGIFWTNHHHMYHLLEKTNEPLLGLNLVFLFWMSLIPFASGVMGANPLLPTSAALYGFIMLMTTLSLALIRQYTLRKGLVHQDEDPLLNSKIQSVSRHGTTKSYLGTAAYLLSIPLAFVSIWLAYLCFVIPPILFFMPHGIDDEKLAAKIEEKN
jgi:uncharacterized membrane protein